MRTVAGTEGASEAGDGAPIGVHLQFGPDPSTSIVVSWSRRFSPDERAWDVAQLWLSDGPGRHGVLAVESIVESAGNGEFHVLRHASALNLKPGTCYGYCIVDGDRTVSGTFVTAAGKPQRFRFTACGDIGTTLAGIGCDPQTSHFAEVLPALIEAAAPMFHLALGDLAYGNHAWA